ncbi:cysteine hydrolase family protein [Novosphingobium decolorationis]|uniref:Cysteine hydrolase n=1 Tax=Novosphingobium decolorationis TaxID=2698673 RepID=A0ABX8EC48_9SPHN|nr:isochorismatase family protein [Novosphingobium decolorationis]MED5547005.1 isochorismatase family protein [Pseudomonadota bacterium]QVM85715.1 cysteine hydrolase [Novosphingobium decolorationis]
MPFVIVVDTQRDFMAPDGALSVAGADELVAPMQAWLEALDPETTEGVLFTFDTHDPAIYPGSPEAEAFPLHCVRESAGWANMLDPDRIPAQIPAWKLEKGVFDMWNEAGLTLTSARSDARPTQPIARDAFFADLARRGVRDVNVIGVAADYCVLWAVQGLLERGFTVHVPQALTKGIDRQIDEVLVSDLAGKPVHLEKA